MIEQNLSHAKNPLPYNGFLWEFGMFFEVWIHWKSWEWLPWILSCAQKPSLVQLWPVLSCHFFTTKPYMFHSAGVFLTLTVMEGNIPMFSYSFFSILFSNNWNLTYLNKLNNSHFKIFQLSIPQASTITTSCPHVVHGGPRFLGARQQIRGRDHRQKPRGHRSASDWWPRWGDHHAGFLPGRHSRNRAKRGCVGCFLLTTVISIMYIYI